MLKVDNLNVHVSDRQIVSGCSFELEPHDFLVVIGPNGAGKTSLIKAIMQYMASSGDIQLFGRDARGMKPAEIAHHIAVLTQHHSMTYAYSVDQVVELGRYAHSTGFFGTVRPVDTAAKEKAMGLAGISDLQHRSVLTLSGGEIQRVFLAQVFAQETPMIILDEPTNQLDIQYQIKVFDLIREWLKEGEHAALAVLHDLNFAFAYATKVLLMHKGKAFAYGPPRHVLTRENLLAVYGVDVYDWMQALLSHWGEPGES